MMNEKNTASVSILKRRISKFKSMKRSYYSLIILTACYVFSLLSVVLSSGVRGCGLSRSLYNVVRCGL